MKDLQKDNLLINFEMANDRVSYYQLGVEYNEYFVNGRIVESDFKEV